MSNKWVYLSDLAPQATIKNLTTGEKRTIMSNAVKDRAPSGLRRTVLEEMPGNIFAETQDVLPFTSELAEEMDECYSSPNGWHYDWPHMPTELEDTPETRQRLIDTVLEQLGEVPFEFKITGLQRRWLFYYSDGSMESQKRFDRYIPTPSSQSPYDRQWKLRDRYQMYYNSLMRDAKVPVPKGIAGKWGNMRACLYAGPAWTLRFQIDGQDPLLERCRVFITDDGTFIGSDWCQRHDYSSYNNGGINLQMGIYTLSGWIMGPCLTYNQQNSGIKLKNTVYKVDKVRDLMAKNPIIQVPQFKDSFAKAQQLIQQYAPATATHATETIVTVDAGPITAAVITEADAAFKQALEQLLVKRAGLSTDAIPARATAGTVSDTIPLAEFTSEQV
jgi:hypothetical protein